MIGSHALESANRDRFVFYTTAPARRFAWPVARASKYARKNVRFAVEQIGVSVAPFGNQPDIAWNIGVGRTGPLAIDDLVIVSWIGNIRRCHARRTSKGR